MCCRRSSFSAWVAACSPATSPSTSYSAATTIFSMPSGTSRPSFLRLNVGHYFMITQSGITACDIARADTGYRPRGFVTGARRLCVSHGSFRVTNMRCFLATKDGSRRASELRKKPTLEGRERLSDRVHDQIESLQSQLEVRSSPVGALPAFIQLSVTCSRVASFRRR